MKKNKIIIVFLTLFILLLIGGYFLLSYLKNKSQKEDELYQDYIPEQEISEEQYRETVVNLYFINKESKEIMAEARAIDARTLSINPYKTLVELLIQGTQNDNLEKIIPDGVKVYDSSIEGGCVIINLSKEILNIGEDETLKNNIINTIAKTLTELTEVESVSFLIEGEENSVFPDEYRPTK